MFAYLFSAASVSSLLCASVVAASSTNVVCIAGQCIQGASNTTIGSTLSIPGGSSTLQLLPGEYTASTGPDQLHQYLHTAGATLTASPGFLASSGALSLPLSVGIQPGVIMYSNMLYSGQATFTPLGSSLVAGNSSATVSASSLAISPNTWVAVSSGSSARLVLWSSVPDISHLPSGSSSSLSILDIQSSSCSPPCSGAGVCGSGGTCTCPPGFTGSSCEKCAPGYFGPSCASMCSSGNTTCASCDDGMTGSGRCLSMNATTPLQVCNCANGICGSNGSCTCVPGWVNSSNGTACAQCASGFFLDSSGSCSACQLGCSSCAENSGICISCKAGYTQNSNDPNSCTVVTQTSSSGATCPMGSYSLSGTCTPCSSECNSCSGGTSNDCLVCGNGRYMLNGVCVPVDGNGVCTGTSLIGNNNKHSCDSCGPKCTTCGIPNFNVASTSDMIKCSGCIAGYVLSAGKCVASCPSGTFLGPDNLTCSACDSSCTSCLGDSKFCLTCANGLLASGGKCIATCPTATFTSSGTCTACHSDCATCSGPSFTQCSSCSSARPVLTGGRCLATCAANQFFDRTSSSCLSCDPSCSSCSASGSSSCLACSSANTTLSAGTCVPAGCPNQQGVVPGLGVCLATLVAAAPATVTSVPGESTAPSTSGSGLSWWQILLMILGCVFIFLAFLMCCRRRARKQRAKRTQAFAANKQIVASKGSWKWRLVRLGERLFGHAPSTRISVLPMASQKIGNTAGSMKLRKLHLDVDARSRHSDSPYDDVQNLIGSYAYQSPTSTGYQKSKGLPGDFNGSRTSAYAENYPRKTPEPRQPVRDVGLKFLSRFTLSTLPETRISPPTLSLDLPPTPHLAKSFCSDAATMSPAETYAEEMRRRTKRKAVPTYSYYSPIEDYLELEPTGISNKSTTNPFRQNNQF